MEEVGAESCITCEFISILLCSKSIQAKQFCFSLFPEILFQYLKHPAALAFPALNSLICLFATHSPKNVSQFLQLPEIVESPVRIPAPTIRTPFWFPGTQLSGWTSPLSSIYTTEPTASQSINQASASIPCPLQKENKIDRITDDEHEDFFVKNIQNIDPLVSQSKIRTKSSSEVLSSAIDGFHAFLPYLSLEIKLRFCETWNKFALLALNTSPESSRESTKSSSFFESSCSFIPVSPSVLVSSLWCIFTIMGESPETKLADLVPTSTPDEQQPSIIPRKEMCLDAVKSIHAIALTTGDPNPLLLSSLLQSLNQEAFFPPD
ncbi:uncharacterized protein MONOS_5512 [Monocercomonoides exilis]|uniref:uncharacterized protein n=1 Tax=Monocercomonoides exilis TaxID=2049356 RepID=UPI00355AB274|nr:hypothetical protein MONOS_5512 [Monocercomonoides exilis]|eukprot:MONOS_5512.1-p1 / transcript=MONOS_5512.1 / gene=MONOS_5512 / organism=Monocercomonoides_exilis_PA203 / gene_product=unspecified product / transcript_product=unspecified product / location=Mono_scaffold00161:94684-95842(-) / protein_length=321 / sequence_SO=supercontig / SO=protein_coding / is_pseudo=false